VQEVSRKVRILELQVRFSEEAERLEAEKQLSQANEELQQFIDAAQEVQIEAETVILRAKLEAVQQQLAQRDQGETKDNPQPEPEPKPKRDPEFVNTSADVVARDEEFEACMTTFHTWQNVAVAIEKYHLAQECKVAIQQLEATKDVAAARACIERLKPEFSALNSTALTCPDEDADPVLTGPGELNDKSERNAPIPFKLVDYALDAVSSVTDCLQPGPEEVCGRLEQSCVAAKAVEPAPQSPTGSTDVPSWLVLGTNALQPVPDVPDIDEFGIPDWMLQAELEVEAFNKSAQAPVADLPGWMMEPVLLQRYAEAKAQFQSLSLGD